MIFPTNGTLIGLPQRSPCEPIFIDMTKHVQLWVAAAALFMTVQATAQVEELSMGFNHSSTEADIDELVQAFAAHDIEVVIHDVQFTCDQLTHIDLSVYYGNRERVGYKSYKLTENMIMISAFDRNGDYGFRVGGDG